MSSPIFQHRRSGTGNVSRIRLDTGRIRYRAVAPQVGQRRGEHLGTFDTLREAEAAIAAWIEQNRGAA